jgi:hypothetical protein
MRFPMLAVFAAVLAGAALSTDDALPRPKEKETKGLRPVVSVPDELMAEGDALLESLGRAPAAAAADTYCIVWYDFETFDLQGWYIRDETGQAGNFFHVDDFAGLGGGDYGRLVPIEGTKSAWCGARPGGDPGMCLWWGAPGYGNGWDQSLVTDPFSFTSPLTLSFHGVFDSEPGWDYTTIEYCFGETWVPLDSLDGVVDTVAAYTILAPVARTKLRFHFISDGAWSDQDGLYDTDGACIIDSIAVSDAHGLIDFEDFESAEVGDQDIGLWHCRAREGHGSYAGLATNLQDKDPCGHNITAQLVFFLGSPWMSDDYPGMPVTPFCQGAGGLEAPCQYETVTSPIIDMTRFSSGCDEVQDSDIPPADLPHIGGAVLRFTVYRDLPVSNLVFYNWSVRNLVDGCPGQWLDRDFCYYGGEREYIQSSFDISDLVGELPVQIEFHAFDMCDAWYGVYGDCSEHTPSPYFDNVRLYRYSTKGPQWNVRDLDLFQDTFPQDGSDMESFCRADMANDIAPNDEFSRIDPGDSAVVQVGSHIDCDIDTLPSGEAMVFFHCNVHFLGPDGKPDLTGPQLEGTYGTWQSTDGGGWDIFLCEPAATSAGNIVPDKFCIDLNDSLFTRGYMVEYYFKAFGADGFATTWPHNAEEANGDRYEFTCLPTLRMGMVPHILFVDDYHNRGTFDGLVQTYMDPALEANTRPGHPAPDRYDTNGPSSGVSNGVGTCVSASSDSSIFSRAYQTVIFDSGDLNSVTISDGSENSDKSNDAKLFRDWLRVSDHKTGLLVMGDNVAMDLSASGAAIAAELMSTICGVTLVGSSYYEMTGGVPAGGMVNPLITGVAGGPFDGLSYYAGGGCPMIDDFDVLEATGPGQYALRYPDYASTEYYAGIFTDQINDAGLPMRTVWIGHSIMHIRNAFNDAPARNKLLDMVYQMFEGPSSSDYTDTEIPKATSLSDNFPNPFNPVTRLKFGLKEKGLVRIRIYDVSGRLVRIIIDEIRDAGSYETVWDGTNGEGRVTASGIYFCRMEAKDFERTLKMVLLR